MRPLEGDPPDMDSDETDCFQMMENLHKNIEKLQGGLFKNVC